MLIGTIYVCHFAPLSLTLTLPGGHKVSAKQNILASFFSHIFQLIGTKFDMTLTQFKFSPDTAFQ